MTILSHTTAWCTACGGRHPARYERRDSSVWFLADCPRGFPPVEASDDADLFLAFRAAGAPSAMPCPPWAAFPHLNVIEITTDCDFSCGYCFNRHRRPQGAPQHRPVAEILALARQARADGAYQVTLSGGEPLLHPEFHRMVRAVRALGLGVVVATNGQVLGKDPTAALRLRRAGGNVASLKFDAVTESTHWLLYGANAIGVQRSAFANCAGAGLRLVGSAVACRGNLRETGAVLREMLAFAPALGVASFQCLWTGPHVAEPFGPLARVSKEAVVKTLCASGAVPGLRPAHFRPVPSCPALHMAFHPDCGVVAMVLAEAGRLSPADEVLDLGRFARGLAGTRAGRRIGPATGLMVGLCAACAAVPGRRGRALRAAWGTLCGRGRSGFVLVAVESLMDWTCQDEQRTCRCGVTMRTGNNAGPKLCFGLACKETA